MGHQTWDMQHGTWNPEDIGDKTSDIRQSDMKSDEKIIGQKNQTKNWTKSDRKSDEKWDKKWDKKKSGKKYQTKNGQQIR